MLVSEATVEIGQAGADAVLMPFEGLQVDGVGEVRGEEFVALILETRGDDHSQIASGNAPQVMASLRNAVIAILRWNDWDNLAEATRHHARDLDRPINTLHQS